VIIVRPQIALMAFGDWGFAYDQVVDLAALGTRVVQHSCLISERHSVIKILAELSTEG
jgi:hypothetical protein